MSVFIKKLYIISFGQFENLEIDFEDGFNLIYGKNESGKSTITNFIEGLLYGFDDGKKVRHFNKKQEIYKPIHSYRYSGYGIFNKNGTNYRISRNFFDGVYEIYNLDTNEVIQERASNLNYPGEFLLNLDYDLYKNLISNYQSQESLSDVKDKITEIFANGGDYYFSPSLATQNLNQKLSEIGSPRAYTKPYAKTIQKIEDLENNLIKLQDLRKNYNLDLEKLYKNRENLTNKNQKLNELRKLRDDYRNNPSYKNLEEQIKYQNDLNFIESQLKKYKDYDDYSIAESKNNHDVNWKNILIYVITSIFFLILWWQTKLSYLLALAIFLPLLVYFINDYNKGKNTDKQYNLDENYIIYKGLLKDKEKIEEILKVLEKQNQGANLDEFLSIKNLDINEIYDQIKSLEKTTDRLNDENLILEKSLAAVEEKLAREVDISDELTFQKDKLNQMETEIAAINLAISKIDEISKTDKSSLADHSDKVNEIIQSISKGKYEKIVYDEDFKPAILIKDGTSLSTDMLSTGFYDQVNFAMKFSINEKNLENFIIFDDAFINYDLDRLRSALFYLLDVGAFRQIIYFTCHMREEEILNSEQINYKLINLEEIWSMD